MVPALLISVFIAFLFWLIFFKLKWLQFSIAWGVVSVYFALHLLLVFLVGLRFVAPYSTDAKVIQHTIQLVPRLSEPTLVTAVLVEPNVPVKKGQPLFQFDRRPYEYKVSQLAAQLAQATQNVLVLKADLEVATQKVAKTKGELEYAKEQQQRTQALAKKGAGSEEDAQKWIAQLRIADAGVSEAVAEAARARLKYESQVGGVNTAVASAQAELAQAQYYLDNTTLVAPEDGYIINLQVRPGMVAGDYRIGAIASFICDADRYLLAAYDQEVLKYVQAGQAVEVALNLYPGQIFKGKVDSVWKASGIGQLLPSGTLPTFNPLPPDIPQGRFAVRIALAGEDPSKFPIGAQGAAAIYTGGGGFAALRRIGIRSYSWLNWLYPIPF
ncbi:MAG: HlyD family secretion protein [Deltaproteobacteria bacterium]|nr:HlyD family secretion protein [Deltaproteobacteria bacterium]MBI3391350.1 HlyD family secretion protein [Deltaproteobacteria bacterium]